MHADADWHTHGSKASLDVAGKNKRRHARASAEYAWCGWRETGSSIDMYNNDVGKESVGGQNVLQSTLQYGYEHFLEQVNLAEQ